MSGPNQPGFVLPPAGQQAYPYPGYPPQTQPQQPPAYQPFPGPIQQQPPMQQQPIQFNQWYANTAFQNHLINASSFHVKQKVELLEVITGWEAPNKYTVKDQAGNKLFYVGEEMSLCSQQLCGKYRPFTLSVRDANSAEILVIERPTPNCSCCFGLCCSDKVVVRTGSGQPLGSIVEDFSILTPSFSLLDAGGTTRLRLEGPMCPLSCFGQRIVFKVMTNDGVNIGSIGKEWGGLVRELFTDADYFSISFAQNLDPAMKAVCIGALFMIDFQYFEENVR